MRARAWRAAPPAHLKARGGVEAAEGLSARAARGRVLRGAAAASVLLLLAMVVAAGLLARCRRQRHEALLHWAAFDPGELLRQLPRASGRVGSAGALPHLDVLEPLSAAAAAATAAATNAVATATPNVSGGNNGGGSSLGGSSSENVNDVGGQGVIRGGQRGGRTASGYGDSAGSDAAVCGALMRGWASDGAGAAGAAAPHASRRSAQLSAVDFAAVRRGVAEFMSDARNRYIGSGGGGGAGGGGGRDSGGGGGGADMEGPAAVSAARVALRAAFGITPAAATLRCGFHVGYVNNSGGGGGGDKGGGGGGGVEAADKCQAVRPASISLAMRSAARLLARTGALLPCDGAEDNELRAAAARAAAAPGSGRLLVAANLYNSGRVAPNFVAQLLALAVALPHGSLAVSIYESGSSDATASWLRLLQMLLCPLRVPFNVTFGGRLQRGRDDATERETDRIEFLAKVRNEAMLPLLTRRDLLAPPAPASAAPTVPESLARHGGGAAAARTSPLRERLVFLNDVFFCADDVLRLVMHDQDVACGVDLSTEGQFLGSGRALSFYDSWVARDALGGMVTGEFPHLSDAAGTARARAGLPVPVYCCWNGMVALSTEPLRRGIRFRAALPGECRSSECSLVCDDFHRLGHGRVIIDPNVVLTYKLHHARAAQLQPRVYDPLNEIQRTTWKEVVSSGPIPNPPRSTSTVLCCNKDADSDNIPWSQCAPRDIMTTNFTAEFLHLQTAV